MTTIDLPWSRPPLSANDRMHWAKKARHVAALRAMAKVKARAQRIQPLDRAIVTLHYRPRERRTRDALNMAPTLKPLTDGLVDAGVLARGDSSEYVDERCVLHEPVKGQRAKLWITIEERA